MAKSVNLSFEFFRPLERRESSKTQVVSMKQNLNRQGSMYQCLMNKNFKNKEGYQLLSLREKDIESIRLWRNAQIDILRQQNPISYDEQQAYFKNVIQPTFDEQYPKQLLLSFLFQDQCIGYGGLTYIDWISLRAEVSFLVDPLRVANEETYASDYTHFLELLCEITFRHLRFHRLFAETFAFRHNHIKVLETFGFKKEGVLREHMYKRSQWVDCLMHGLLSKEWRHAE